MRFFLGVRFSILLVQSSFAGEPPRARDLGVQFDGNPGPFNAITDVVGVTVGHHTLIEDLPNGRSVRTGVTAILPLGRDTLMHPVFGAWFSLNGCGEMTSTTGVGKNSSIIIVVATDAPLLPHQLNRVVKRAALGLARTGAVAHNGSGDIFVAFTTAERSLGRVDRVMTHKSVPNEVIDPLFTATVQATEEAIVNALVAARDMTGNQGHSVKAIPHDKLMEVLEQYGRLEEKK